MSDSPRTHRRWVGSLLSFIVPGAGLFMAGNKTAGWRWFLGLTSLWMIKVIVISFPNIPNLMAFAVLSFITLALYCVLIVRSYKHVRRIGIAGLLVLLILALSLTLLKGAVARLFTHPFKMPTSSMKPTIQPGDHLLAQGSAYWFGPPDRGDVIVFNTDQMDVPLLPKGHFYVKRIAALPGETVEINEGRLVVNAKPLATPPILAKDHFALYPLGQSSSFFTNKYIISEDHYFVVGDVATNSYDSRYFGPIPRNSIYGKATKIYWPFKRVADIQ